MRRRELLVKADDIKPGLPKAPGCYIAFHRKSDGANCAVTYDVWPDLQNAGEEADGVLLVVNGRDPIVIAPTEASSGCNWAPGIVGLCNNAIKNSEDGVTTDFNGRNYIANIVAKIAAKEISTDYAGPLCYQYSRPGIPATKWWLPSSGELHTIYINKADINFCLEVISGASQLSDIATYWSSTEQSGSFAWARRIVGYWDYYIKSSHLYWARAVAAFE